jgi:hypothetical protein
MLTIAPDGLATFRIFAPHATSAAVIGDFTGWTRGALPMARAHPGWWSVQTRLDPGTYSFCYLIDEGIWLADYAAHGVYLNRDGHWLSVAIVPEVGAPAAPAAPAAPVIVARPAGGVRTAVHEPSRESGQAAARDSRAHLSPVAR